MLMAWPSTIVFHLINQNITITKDTESKIINVFSWKMVIIFFAKWWQLLQKSAFVELWAMASN